MRVHNFSEQMNLILESYPLYKVAHRDSYPAIMDFIESEKMVLNKNINLAYSRRPFLEESFLEGNQFPLMVVDDEVKFFGCISEMKSVFAGKDVDYYYTSDLRISSFASKKVKGTFRSFFRSMIEKMDHPCYTAVLKENKRAIETLTKGKSGIYYNKLFDYFTITIPVIHRFVRLNKKNQVICEKIKSLDEECFDIVDTTLDFSHGIFDEGSHFKIYKDDQFVGFATMTRPKKRKIYVECHNLKLKILSKFLKLVYKENYEEKIPWCYLTNFFTRNDIDVNELRDEFLKIMIKEKYIRAGELILIAGDKNLDTKLRFPVIKTDGSFYDVSTIKKDFSLLHRVSLNPLCL